MQRSPQAAEFLEVYQHELDETVRRRREAGFPLAGNDAEARRQIADELVGLALSGGGVRSASLNLGLIQAMYETGLLREMDYLSTVSGGGYVGACLSSAALKPETRFDWQKPDPNGNGKKDDDKPEAKAETNSKPEAVERGFELAVMPDGRQPKRVNELIHSGTSLRRPLLFLNRYLIGIVLTNVVVLSGLFTICAAAAFLFRCTDYTVSINWLYALGYRGDITRAFFPATVFLALWLAFWAISYWQRGAEATGRIARVFLALTIVSFLMAIAMLVGTGDVSLTYVRDNWGIEPPKEAVESISRDLQKVFLIGLVIAFLPYLRVQDLIRSGTRPRNVFEGWIFAIASRALLYGLPLLIFGYFAREDISGFNAQRMGERHGVAISFRSDFHPLDFKDWRGTWREIELQSSAGTAEADQQGLVIEAIKKLVSPPIVEDQRYAVGREMWRLAGAEDARASIQVVDDMAQFDNKYGYVQRWLLLLAQTVTQEANPLTEQFVNREKYLRLRTKICKELTDKFLCSPKTYEKFKNAAADFPGMDPDQKKRLEQSLAGLLAKGAQLESRIKHLEGKHKVSFEQWLSPKELPIDLERSVREQYARTEEELKDANWQMLRAYFGDELTPKSTIYAGNVLIPDQDTRLIWLVSSLVVFVVSGLLVNLNATSLHGFYRDGISNVWIDPVPGFGKSIPLTRLDTTAHGAPYQLINATLHLLGARKDMDQPETDGFLFSRCYCGSMRTGFSATDEYGDGRYDLPNAIAVSGAAITPTQVHNPLLAVLLFLSNSRLGQWLPNPAHKDRLSDTVNFRLKLPFSPIRLVIGLFQKAELRNHCFVADGGHHENLGLEVLLERRVRTIIVSDATCDPSYQFEDLVRLHRRIAARLGIRIEGFSEPDHFLDLSPLIADQTTRHSNEHMICARIHYPRLEYLGEYGEPLNGLLIYIKPGLTGDESLDLRSHHEHSPSFPHDTTADQFYDPDRFESYRQLGYHIGHQLAPVYREQIRRIAEPASEETIEAAPEETESDETAAELRFLIERLAHENPEFQRLAVHAIAEELPGLPEASRQPLVTALTDLLFESKSDKSLLEKTVWALGEAGPAVEPEIERILQFVENHPGDVRIRAGALELLKELVPLREELKAPLERLQKNASPLIQHKAASLLNGEQ